MRLALAAVRGRARATPGGSPHVRAGSRSRGSHLLRTRRRSAIPAPRRRSSRSSALPKTLPPEAMPSISSRSRAVPKRCRDEAVREALRASALPGNIRRPANIGYRRTTPPPAHLRPSTDRRRPSVGARARVCGSAQLARSLLGLGGAALAAVFYQQHQPSSSDPPLVARYVRRPRPPSSPLIDARQLTTSNHRRRSPSRVTPGHAPRTPTCSRRPRPPRSDRPVTRAPRRPSLTRAAHHLSLSRFRCRAPCRHCRALLPADLPEDISDRVPERSCPLVSRNSRAFR